MTSRGFTLLEVLVAIVVVGLVSISTLGAMSSAVRASDRAAAALVASELAEERLQSMLTLSPDVLVDSADGVTRAIPGLPDWSWSASLERGAQGLGVLAIHVEGRVASAQRRRLRAGGGP